MPIILKLADMKKIKNTGKYNKITQQQKFHLLTLVLNDNLLIKQAAKQVGINYSTAKTIIFFHRNNARSYQFDLQSIAIGQKCEVSMTASFMELPTQSQDPQKEAFMFQPISIISTIGSKSLLYFQNAEVIHSHSSSPKNIQNTNNQATELSQELNGNCQRITRARSALQAMKNTIQPMRLQQQLINVQLCSESSQLKIVGDNK